MKGLASVAFGIATVMGTATLAASMASIAATGDSVPGLRGLTDNGLWTVEPTNVDPARQSYERLPPALSTYAVASRQQAAAKQPVVAASTIGDFSAQTTKMSAEHLNWCSSRYRSFDPTTNTYRSFQGQVRVCQPPFEGSEHAGGPTLVDAADAMPNAATWCANRYKSYRADDNTYQPYNGHRVKCNPPAEAVVAVNN